MVRPSKAAGVGILETGVFLAVLAYSHGPKDMVAAGRGAGRMLGRAVRTTAAARSAAAAALERSPGFGEASRELREGLREISRVNAEVRGGFSIFPTQVASTRVDPVARATAGGGGAQQRVRVQAQEPAKAQAQGNLRKEVRSSARGGASPLPAAAAAAATWQLPAPAGGGAGDSTGAAGPAAVDGLDLVAQLRAARRGTLDAASASLRTERRAGGADLLLEAVEEARLRTDAEGMLGATRRKL